jgi:hypothetical protein
MAGISQNGIKSGFFVISGRNSGEMGAESECYFEKTKPICRSLNKHKYFTEKGL